MACLSSSQAKLFGGARGNGPTVYEAILLAVFLIFLGPWTSVAGTHWFIHPKNQHQQKSIKIPSSTAPTNVQRDVNKKAHRKIAPFFHPKICGFDLSKSSHGALPSGVTAHNMEIGAVKIDITGYLLCWLVVSNMNFIFHFIYGIL